MLPAFNEGNSFISFSAVMQSFSALLILLGPIPSFADRIFTIRQYTTLDVGCDLNSSDDFIGTTKILTYGQPAKLIFNCERNMNRPI